MRKFWYRFKLVLISPIHIIGCALYGISSKDILKDMWDYGWMEFKDVKQ
jgi:hypothetical protein